MTAYLMGDAGNVVIRASSYSEQKSRSESYDTTQVGGVEVGSSALVSGGEPASWHILDRRIAYLARSCGLIQGDFALMTPDGAAVDDQHPAPDELNCWPARFLTAVAQEDNAAFVRRYAATFVTDPDATPPKVGLFDRLAEVPSLAAYDGVLGRWLDAADIIHVGDLMAVMRQQGGRPLLLTMADVHPSLAVSRWCLVTDAGRRKRFEPFLRLLRTLGVEDFDPLTMQCRVLELRERLREVQLESERALSAQATEFERRLHAALQKKDHEVAEVWRAKDAEIADLSARLAEREQTLHAKSNEVLHLRQRLAEVERQLEAASADRRRVEAQWRQVEAECRQLEQRLQQAEAERREVETQLGNVLRSRSWRITAPLRRLFGGR
ncbi:MAG: hypothetical protein NZ585_09385 [Chloracidobacterium sp.]|nr:hypothetical protein [Chloracidobacterium sp.]MDW8217008.1 hypothetical protein [Acidobacteriota bacterium]